MAFSKNNFDLIRLFAATNVAAVHAIYFLEVDGLIANLVYFFKAFPGVPIFFFISGLLISRSYENSQNIASYSMNRALRIYPALLICTLLSFASVYLSGYIEKANPEFWETAVWLLGQISFVQFYNPEFMRSFGTGVLNGSLWTIAVELQFYFLTPLLYLLLPQNKLKGNLILIAGMAISIAAHQYRVFAEAELGEIFYFKIFNVSFLPWVYMFLFGIFVQRNFDFFYNILKGRFIIALVGYIALFTIADNFYELELGNNISAILFFVLALIVFSSAYTQPSLSNSVLRKNDVSYGIYIYHIPVINLIMYFQLSDSKFTLLAVFIVTAVCAILSWHFIERPALRLKHLTLKNRRN